MTTRRKRTATNETAAIEETPAVKKTSAKKETEPSTKKSKQSKEETATIKTSAKRKTKPSIKKSKEETSTDKTAAKEETATKQSKKSKTTATTKTAAKEEEAEPLTKRSRKPKEETTINKTAAKEEVEPLTKRSRKPKEETTIKKTAAKKKSKPSTKKPKEEGVVKKTADKEGTEFSTKKWDSIDFDCTKKNAKGNTHNLKICCWNIGGLRSWVKKECLQFLDNESPDILCMQETKCDESKLPDEIKNLEGYKQYWCSSKKDGYAGVGLLTKLEPINIIYGIEDNEMDEDGRCITAEFDQYYVVCVYVPNAGRKLVTLPKRLEWNKSFKNFVNNLDSIKPVIICGDMNVSHNEIDLARPQSNKKNAGFTQEERDGMSEFLGEGYIDTFRHLYPDTTDSYTFWTYMANARSKNIGWRLDYFIVSERIVDNVCDNVMRSEVLGSDHCPITLFLNI